MFGNVKGYKEKLLTLPYAQKKNLMREVITNQVFEDTFKDDDHYAEMAGQLDVEGKTDLLRKYNWDKRKAQGEDTDDDFYNGSKRINAEEERRLKSRVKIPALSNTTPLGYAQDTGATISNMKIGWDKSAQERHDEETRNELYAQTQKRRETSVQGDASSLYNQIINTASVSYNDVNRLFMEKSPHYKTFRGTKWLNDYTEQETLKDYAMYEALKRQYGEGMADTYLDRTIQNRVAEGQDGRWTNNTLKKIFVSAYSDIGSTVAFLATMDSLGDEERAGIIQAGKDPDKPLDKDGNITHDPKKIVDYAENENIWTNPRFWNDAYMYNKFTKDGVAAVKRNSGVSDSVNIREFGHTPDFLSWETGEEGIAQSGHILAIPLMGGGTAKGMQLLGKGVQYGLKMMKVGDKVIKGMAEAGGMLQNMAATGISAIPGAQMEAAGQVSENLQRNELKINQQIQKELHEYSRSINLNSKKHKAGIDEIFKRLKAEDARRVKRNSTDKSKQELPLSDETLRREA